MRSLVYRPVGYPLSKHIFATRTYEEHKIVQAWIYANDMGWDTHMEFTGCNGYGFSIKDEAKRAWFILKWAPEQDGR